jgi:hypothetical protein
MKTNLEEQIKRCKEWTEGKYTIYCKEKGKEYCPMICKYALKQKIKEEK